MQFFYSAISRTSFVYTKVTMLLLLLAGLLLQANSALAACGPYQNIVVVGTRDGVVWGSGPYGERSNFGAAAVHAGLIEPGETATIQRTAVGARTLVGTTQQGVTSTSYPLSMCAVTLSIAGTSNDNEDDPATDDGVGTNTGAGGASNGGAPVTIEQLLATIRSLQDQLAQMQGGGASGAAPGTSLAIGAAVRTTSNLNVRDIPATTGTLLGVEPAGTQGTITDGPTTANGYTWWKVRYTSGGHGWSVDTYLVRVGGATSGCGTGMHLENGRCVSDTRSCTLARAVSNGTGVQVYQNGAWGSCEVKCDAGYERTTRRTFSRSAGSALQTIVKTIVTCERNTSESTNQSVTITGVSSGMCSQLKTDQNIAYMCDAAGAPFYLLASEVGTPTTKPEWSDRSRFISTCQAMTTTLTRSRCSELHTQFMNGDVVWVQSGYRPGGLQTNFNTWFNTPSFGNRPDSDETKSCWVSPRTGTDAYIATRNIPTTSAICSNASAGTPGPVSVVQTRPEAITGQVTSISAPNEVYYNTPFDVVVTMKNPGNTDGLTRASIDLTTDPTRTATIENNGSVEKVLKAGESAQFTLTVRVISTAGPTKASSWTTARFSSLYGPAAKWIYEPISVLRIPYNLYVANCDIYSGNCPASVTPGNDDLQGANAERKQVYSSTQGKWVYCDENRTETGCACVGEAGKYYDYNPNQTTQLACKIYVGGVTLPYGLSTLPNLTARLEGRGAVMCNDNGSTSLVLAQSTCSVQ